MWGTGHHRPCFLASRVQAARTATFNTVTRPLSALLTRRPASSLLSAIVGAAPCKSAGFVTPLTSLYVQILAFAFSCYRGHRCHPTCGAPVRPGGRTTIGLRSTPRQWRDKCRHLLARGPRQWGSWVFPLNHVRRPDTGNCYSLVSAHFRGRPLAIILNLV